MKDFAMQLTQKCVSMGLLDESYSEWFAYKNIACWGNAPSPFDLHFPMQAAHPFGTLFIR